MDIADLADQYIEGQMSLALQRLRKRQKLNRAKPALKVGICIECHERIPAERIQLVPECSHCISCAEQLERSQAIYHQGQPRQMQLDDFLYSIS